MKHKVTWLHISYLHVCPLIRWSLHSLFRQLVMSYVAYLSREYSLEHQCVPSQWRRSTKKSDLKCDGSDVLVEFTANIVDQYFGS